MGNECNTKQTNISESEASRYEQFSLSDTKPISEVLIFKNHTEYESKMKHFKHKIIQQLNKIVSINEYKQKDKKLRNFLNNSSIKYIKLQPLDKLYDTMLQIYQKINSVYSNTFCFPKTELEKVSYDLISRYMNLYDLKVQYAYNHKELDRGNDGKDGKNEEENEKYKDFSCDDEVFLKLETMINESRRFSNISSKASINLSNKLSKSSLNIPKRSIIRSIHNEIDEIVSKIIKRLNFFSDEVPFKLNKIEKIIKLKKIFAFGYDNYNRINFYIRPNFTDTSIYDTSTNTNTFNVNPTDFPGFSSNSSKNLNKKYSIDSYTNNNNFGSFSNKSFNNKLSSGGNVNFDYILFIFFIIEFFLPILKENFNFSQDVNVFIDFNYLTIDSELIIMILHYFSTMYPMLLNRVVITNYVIEDSNVHESFVKQIEKEDLLKVVLFTDETIKLRIVSYTSPNCVPVEYGGYYYLDFNSLDERIRSVDELIEWILSSLLVKDC